MKHVCISLAAALALAVPSFAQSAEETPFSCEVRTKYNQPGTSYSSLAKAVAAVPADGKIHYVSVIGEGPAEITTPITVTAGQNISLYSEKSGITYDIPASLTAPVFKVESGARLTFTKNGKYVYGEGVQGTFLENYGYVSIANGTFTLDAGDSGATFINHGGAEDNSMKCSATVSVASGTAFRNDGVLTISSGTTTAESGIAVLSNGGTLTLSTSKSVIGSEGAIVVNGGVAKFEKGTLSSTGSAPAVLLCASNAPIDASFKYTSLSLTSTGGDALKIAGSAQVCKVQINKGTFTPAEGKASIRVTHDTEDADITLSVVDGVFNAPIVSEGSAPIVGFILGGSFVASPNAALVADGLTFEKNADGLYEPTAVAQIGDTTYLTFKEAIVAATPGDTVTLLRDVTIPESTPITVYGLTVDLDGHTLTNTATGGSGIRLTLADAEGTPANFTLVGPGSVVAATPLYASGAYNYARPYTVIVDESVILKSTVEGNPQIELSGSARVAATDANVTRLGKGGFKVNDGSAEWLYGTCAGAFLNVPEGGTFTLCQDFSGPSRLEFPIDPTLLQTRATGIVKSATLDLAGHAFTSTLDGNNADLIVIDSGADVTIKGGSLTAIGDLAHMALPEDNNGNAALTLEDVTATSSSDDYLIVSNGSTDNINITVRDSTLTATGANTVAIFAPAGGDSIVTLDNAIIKSPYGVQVCAGDLFVKGDTRITTTAANVASTKTGDGPIPDGAAISIVNRAGYGDAATTGSSVGKVTIEGSPVLIAQGKGAKALDVYAWDSASAQQDWPEDAEHVTISGGTFSQAVPEAFCAPGYAPKKNADGTYSVVGWYETGVDKNGDGVADTWTIRNEGDLAAFRDKVNGNITFAGCTVTLKADLDLSDMGTWIPIGEGNAGGASKNGGFFAGTFEGGNYLIANVTASETKVSEGSGLFGWVRGATIRDLNVSGWFSNTNGAAGLIGVVDAQGAYTTTTITNVHNVGGTVQGTARGSNAGGIIGEIRSGVVTITGCSNAAAVTASINHSDTAGVLCAGGIVGDANGASVTISDCSNTGAVTAYPDDEGNAAQTPVFAGGIVGRMGTGSIAACTGTGDVSATGKGTVGQGALLGGVVVGSTTNVALALTVEDAEAGRVALFTAAEVVPEGLTVKVAPAEGASAPAGTVLAVDDGTLYCNLLYLANRVAGESEGETFDANAQQALLNAAGGSMHGNIAVSGRTAVDKPLTTAQVNEALACFEGSGLIVVEGSLEGEKTLVVAYDFGITDVRVTGTGDLVVEVAAQDMSGRPLAFAEGASLSLRNGETALAATPATVEGVTTLTVQAANVPGGNLALSVSVAPAAAEEAPAN